MNHYARFTHRRGWWRLSVGALGDQQYGRPSFFRRKLAFVHGSACLPSFAPLAAVLIPLMGKPVDGLFGRSQRNLHLSIPDHNGFFPMVGKHVRQPRRLLSTLSNSLWLFSFPVQDTRGEA